MSGTSMQYAISVNGRIYTQEYHANPMQLMFGQREYRPVILATAEEAEQAAAGIREHLSQQFGLTPIVQVVHRYCSPWIGGDPSEGLAGAVQKYLDQEEGA